MTNLAIENCKRCNKIFKKVNRDVCADCVDQEQQHFKQVYKLLNNSEAQGGISMQELANQAGISTDLLDSILRNHGFGSAMDFLKVPCQTCGELVMGSHRRGKYCMHCSNAVAKEAGVEIRSREELEEENSARRRLKENLERQTRIAEPQEDKSRYGFKRFN